MTQNQFKIQEIDKDTLETATKRHELFVRTRRAEMCRACQTTTEICKTNDVHVRSTFEQMLSMTKIGIAFVLGSYGLAFANSYPNLPEIDFTGFFNLHNMWISMCNPLFWLIFAFISLYMYRAINECQ